MMRKSTKIKMIELKPPQKIPIYLRLGIWISEKVTGKKMMPARLLSWSPRSAIGSGFLESLVVHKDPTLSPRLLKLLRLQISFKVSCPFCIDMNGHDFELFKITLAEVNQLKGQVYPVDFITFSKSEQIALEYALRLSETPPNLNEDFQNILKTMFSDREIVILTVTISQVNYWTRLIQGFNLPSAGFDQDCSLPLTPKK